MGTYTTPIHPEEIVGWHDYTVDGAGAVPGLTADTTTGRITWTDATRPPRVRLQGLSPLYPVRVRVSLTGDADAGITVGTQGVSHTWRGQVTNSEHTFADIDPAYPIDIHIKGGRGSWSARILIDVDIPDDIASGPGAWALLVRRQDEWTQSSLLGSIILGSSRLPDPNRKVGGWDTIGRIRLGEYSLAPADAWLTWQDTTQYATQVESVRGIDHDGVIGRARAGTLTATWVNALDPRVQQLHRGRPVALAHLPSRRLVFGGAIDRLSSRTASDGTARVDMVAVDTQTRMAARTIPGVTQLRTYHRTMAESYGDIVAFVDVPQIPTYHKRGMPTSWRRTGVGVAEHQGTVTEWLDIAAATTASGWYVDPYGALRFCSNLHETPLRAAIRADSAWPERRGSEPQLEASAITVGYDTDRAITQLDITNVYSEHESIGSGQWRMLPDTAKSDTYQVLSPSLAADYGERAASVTIAAGAYTDDPLELLQARLDSQRHMDTVTGVTIPHYRHRLADPIHGPATVGAAALTDLYDRAVISSVGREYEVTIVGITWRITPTSVTQDLQTIAALERI